MDAQYSFYKDIPPPKDVNLCSEIIATLNGVEPNPQAFSGMKTWLDIQLGPVNLDTTRVKKGKLIDPTREEPTPNPHETSITQRFNSLFIELDFNNPNSLQNTLTPLSSSENLPPEAIANTHKHFDSIHLLLLSLLRDNETGPKPINQLGQILQINLPSLLKLYHQAILLPNSAQRLKHCLARDPQLNQQSLTVSLRQLIDTPEHRQHPGFGAAQALYRFQQQLREVGDPRADNYEQLMHHCNRLATDPKAVEKLRLADMF